MSTNAGMIAEARSAANMGREYAENYSWVNPQDSIPWRNAYLIDRLTDALEAAGSALSAEKRDAALAEKHWHRDKADLDLIAAQRDAALAVIAEARNQVRAGISERALMRILKAAK